MTNTTHPFEFLEMDYDPLTIEGAVFQALGAASTCWECLEGTGVFDSEKVKEIGETLLAFIDYAARKRVFKNMQQEVLAWGERKGWVPDAMEDVAPADVFGKRCALLTSEISEALEAYRLWGLEPRVKFNRGDEYALLPVDDPNAVRWQESGVVGKPEGVPSEFADLLIRLLHYSGVYEIDLADEYEGKMAYNEKRPWKHGGRSL